MKRPVEDGLSLLIGAGLGVALMYVLDPEEGAKRRKQIEQAARDRLARAQDRLSHAGEAASAGVEAGLGYVQDAVGRAAHSPAVNKLASHATDAARAIYDDLSTHAREVAADVAGEVHGRASAAARDYQQQATNAAEALRSKVSGHLDQLRGKASDLSGNAKAKYGSWLNKSTAALGRDEDHHYIGQTACALGSLALGAGAVYLFDPDQGQQRRARLIERTTYSVREVGDFFRKTGRRLVSGGQVVAKGVANHAKEAVRDWNPTDTGETAEQEPVSREPANESNQASMGT